MLMPPPPRCTGALPVRVGLVGIAAPTRTQLTVHSLNIHMFFSVAPRTSDAVAVLQVSPVLGVVLVEFASGHAYEYTNVSRRAICNLLMNPNMSLGFWVNQNCIRPERTQRLDLCFYTTDGENRGAAGFIGA